MQSCCVTIATCSPVNELYARGHALVHILAARSQSQLVLRGGSSHHQTIWILQGRLSAALAVAEANADRAEQIEREAAEAQLQFARVGDMYVLYLKMP